MPLTHDEEANEELPAPQASTGPSPFARLHAFAEFQRARAAESEAYAADLLGRLEHAAEEIVVTQTTELACLPESQRGALKALKRGTLESLALFAKLTAEELATVRSRAHEALRASLSAKALQRALAGRSPRPLDD